jgi:hypothetical protein
MNATAIRSGPNWLLRKFLCIGQSVTDHMDEYCGWWKTRRISTIDKHE